MRCYSRVTRTLNMTRIPYFAKFEYLRRVIDDATLGVRLLRVLTNTIRHKLKKFYVTCWAGFSFQSRTVSCTRPMCRSMFSRKKLLRTNTCGNWGSLGNSTIYILPPKTCQKHSLVQTTYKYTSMDYGARQMHCCQYEASSIWICRYQRLKFKVKSTCNESVTSQAHLHIVDGKNAQLLEL